MGKHFLRDLPPEIRDQIYTYVLASPATGIIDLRPWTTAVEKSLSILRTCKQVHRECKDLIWQHNGMALRDDHNQLFDRLAKCYDQNSPAREVTVIMLLELLDVDELAWACQGLKAILSWPLHIKVSAVMLFTQFDRPRAMSEFTTLLHIRANGELLDGRRFYMHRLTHGVDETLSIQAVWPAFSHWGKQRWFKQMLVNNADPTELIEDLRKSLGAKLLAVDGTILSSLPHDEVRNPIKLDPRNGSITMMVDDLHLQ